MADFRFVTDRFAVSAQISVEDIGVAAGRGFALIVNNRPDGEAPDQPTGAAIEAAARAAGLDYIHVPVAGRPSAAQVEAMRRAVNGAPGKVLAYCRSGTRSIVTWALAQAASGSLTAGELVRVGRAAGYDLSALS